MNADGISRALFQVFFFYCRRLKYCPTCVSNFVFYYIKKECIDPIS